MNAINKKNQAGPAATASVAKLITKLAALVLVTKFVVAPGLYCLATVLFLLKP